ncbi:MAG: sugar transporter, ATP-binding protein, partial [Jatrophihabitantaceae bacterium]|nr:sugar transporter, ATP-binding protein [Jatrophihabitantaceae bacterium]
HKLDEVLSVADDITVLRRGTTVGTVDPRTTNARQLAELMVGSQLPTPETSEPTVRETVVLQVRNLTVLGAGGGRPLIDDVSFDIRQGEVLGLAGVEGNGQSELVEAIMGIRAANSGTITLRGTPIGSWSTRARREAGIGFIPEDRHRQGLLLEAPLWENRILGHQTRAPNVKGPFVDTAGARADTARIVAEYDVRTPSIDTKAGALSGGNQQKLIVGREMSGKPILLIASHPTRGVDVGAQAAIWDHLRQARRDGLAVLLISADMEELIGMSDRLQVILRGRFVAEADPQTVTPTELGSAMTGAGVGAA